MEPRCSRISGWLLIFIAILISSGCKHKPPGGPPPGSYLEDIYGNANTTADSELFCRSMPAYLDELDGLMKKNKYDLPLIFRASGAHYGYAFSCLEDADKKARARKFLDLTTLGIFYVTSISLYFNREWTRWIWEMCKAESGRDWMINSGVFHFDHENVSPAGHAVCAALFATYPLALKLGYRLAEGKGCECECGCCAGESEV